MIGAPVPAPFSGAATPSRPRGREDRLAPDRLGGPVEGVGHGAPHRIVRRGPVGLQSRGARVDLVEVVDVLVRLVLEHVEPETARLVALRAQGVHLDGVQEPLPELGLDPHLHPDGKHAPPRVVEFTAARGRAPAAEAPSRPLRHPPGRASLTPRKCRSLHYYALDGSRGQAVARRDPSTLPG